jgi:hypothetical protein
MKPKAGAAPDAEERRFMARVATLPCLVCGVQPVTLHHISATVHGGRISRSHKLLAPLCARHHQKVYDPKDSDPISVEGLGHARFFRKYGIDLLAVAERLWLKWSGPTANP